MLSYGYVAGGGGYQGRLVLYVLTQCYEMCQYPKTANLAVDVNFNVRFDGGDPTAEISY